MKSKHILTESAKAKHIDKLEKKLAEQVPSTSPRTSASRTVQKSTMNVASANGSYVENDNWIDSFVSFVSQPVSETVKGPNRKLYGYSESYSQWLYNNDRETYNRIQNWD